MNRIPGSRLLISCSPGKALRTLVDIARLAERCQQAFSKPCLVNLISKDTNLVGLFSIYPRNCSTDMFHVHNAQFPHKVIFSMTLYNCRIFFI